jgi:flagellar motor switch protein FliM
LLTIEPGDVLSLGYLVRSPLEVRIQDSPKFLGRLVVHEGRTALRVDQDAATMLSEA